MGAALAFSLFEIARHPDIQELVVLELKEVFGNDDRTPSLSDLRRLKYLEQCIKETLRLYPSVPLIFRTLTEDAKLGTAACMCSGFVVPQSSMPGLGQPATGPYSEPNKSIFYTLSCFFNPLNAELNPIRYLLALVRARHIVHVSRIRVKIRFSFILPSPLRTSWFPLPFTFFYQNFACIPCRSHVLHESTPQFLFI